MPPHFERIDWMPSPPLAPDDGPIDSGHLDRMTLGGVTFHKPDIVFAEFSIFHVLGLDKGPALIIGIDQFLDMGRSATNVIGNSLATAVVAKWEGEDVTQGLPDFPPAHPQPAAAS